MTSLPDSSSEVLSCDIYVKKPIKSVGAWSSKIGKVPIKMGINGNPMMPQSTLVGQSGIPIRILTADEKGKAGLVREELKSG